MIDPVQTRARYASHAAAYRADSIRVRPDQLTVRCFNFGQHWRTPDIENVRYSVTLPDPFFVDLLLAWFGDGEPPGTPGFVMNTIDGVDFARGAPRLWGQARRAGIPVRYQDV